MRKDVLKNEVSRAMDQTYGNQNGEEKKGKCHVIGLQWGLIEVNERFERSMEFLNSIWNNNYCSF